MKHLCPICQEPMRPGKASNATSRFVQGVYICSACGVREAFEGQIWKPKLREVQAIAKQQDGWTS